MQVQGVQTLRLLDIIYKTKQTNQDFETFLDSKNQDAETAL